MRVDHKVSHLYGEREQAETEDLESIDMGGSFKVTENT
jgi:hypothetical protein